MMEQKPYIYFDNAATSWPKPKAVIEAVTEAMVNASANPGRGSHAMAVKASRVLFQARTHLATLFNIKNANDIVFTHNTTVGLNMAIKGLLHEHDHVICTNVEHNSVRRPLASLKKAKNVEVSILPSNEDGVAIVQELEGLIKSNTRLLIINHSSNLLGSINPVKQLSEIAHKHNVMVLVDAAQSAGIIPIDVVELGIDMLAFPGHKGLLGPQGTGGLYIAPHVDLMPLYEGGTGSQSESELQPDVRPDKYESGTQNTAGIAGLLEGIKYINAIGISNIYDHEYLLTQKLIKGLQKIKGITCIGPKLNEPRTGIVSFYYEKTDPSELAFILDQHYNIAVRSGFHCTPDAHQLAGTAERGAVRVSVGYSNTIEEVELFLDAMKEIAAEYER